LRAFVGPVAEFGTGTGALSDIDLPRPPIGDPPVPAERQRRTLDAPSEEPVTEVVVKTTQPIKVEGVLVKPDDLHDFRLAGGPVPVEEALVDEREPIVRPRVTVG
jgi:hypothetical protein